MRVLVCDDEQRRCEEIVKEVRETKQANPEALFEKELKGELAKLFKDIRSCLDNPAQFKRTGKAAFDGADIVILDNNLAHLEVEGARLTAESIAGYVRAFTKATYVISLNLNPDVDFDLRFLVGDYSTRADLALNIDHLANVGLWTGNQKSPKDGVLPWYWPRLSSVAERRSKQIECVTERLDQPVVEALGFDEDAISYLSPHARGSLSPDAASDGEIAKGGTPFNNLTFRHVFMAKDRSLPIKSERERLSQAENNEKPELRDIIARVVAADIDLWFRRDIGAPQEPPVDVPPLPVPFPLWPGGPAEHSDQWDIP